ncbi:hypothetical protein CVT25_010021 [Psilocybe cyanescens]|uniref:5'-deoxynucleotidase n=1 Tax=Psilocybe cyanescens TaxID=93625 RepID=A0A409X3A9_PSICY|nr:hypothetical protein CVT25_010021 [Psilocybe cyanescens]
MSTSITPPKRVFPPLYTPTGDSLKDKLAFIHILERLKVYHMYRMAMLAMLSEDPNLDISKCVMMALVHDLAEAQVGDIAPREGIPKAEKHRLESEAMHNIVHDMLHNSPAAQKINSLWMEYEEGQSPEAKFVKDLDRFEMASQALEYERNHGASLQPFFDSSVTKIRHSQVQEWGQGLMEEREQMKNRSMKQDT